MTGEMGVDPSLDGTGIAWADGQVATVRGEGDERLRAIYSRVYAAAAGHRLAAVEDLPTHAKGAGLTGMAQGVVRLALLDAQVPYVLVPAASLKKYATGSGTATKADMRMALYQRAGIDNRDENQVDAWWLRALAADLSGEPLLTLPKTHRVALDKLPKAVWR